MKELYPDSQITGTGHSLGGALAELIAAKFEDSGIQGITFGAPGVSHLPDNPEFGLDTNGEYRNVMNIV